MAATTQPVSTAERRADRKPFNATALISFILAASALFLALLGSLFAGNQLRLLSMYGIVRALVVLVTYLGPIGMGLAAMYYGSMGLDQIEADRAHQRGDGFGVFAVLMGMLTVVIASIETFAHVIWPLL